MYNWIETTFNVSGGVTQAIAVVLALAVVLVLFGLFIFILKRLMGGQATQSRNRQPRIAVMDSATVDTRRRLVLIRRDNIEHLLLIGGPSDVVVEQNIVRNTPLTQQRPGHGMVPARGPMAPGPDIPARPDDLVAQHEPTPPPSVQARPPAADARTPATDPAGAPGSALTGQERPSASAGSLARPAPVTAPAPASPASAAAVPAAAASAAPQPAVPQPAAPQPTAPQSSAALSAPVSSRAPVSSPSPAAAKPAASGGLNRAADLLRAATQNGFNRTAAKAPAPDTASAPASPQAAAPLTASPAAATPPAPAGDGAPEVRAAARSEDPTAAQEDSKTGSALKSLARPFTARDRPTYGNHSISPPASGPAARAKTALLKPQETPRDQGKVEPVMTAPAPVSPARALAASTALGTGAALPLAAEAASGAAPVSAATATQPGAEEGPDRTGTDKDPVPAADVPVSDNSGSGNPASGNPVSASPAQDNADEAAPQSAEKTPAAASAADGPDISLDISDLLEEAPAGSDPVKATESASGNESGNASETAQPGEETVKADAPASDADRSTQVTASADGQAEAVEDAPAGDRKPTSPQTPPKTATGLGDKNPIEDEMAKILDELGGQAN